MMRNFTHKGYGRIYTENEDDIEKVHEIIRQMDNFEYSYLPENLIAPFSEYPKVTYTGKFSDLDLNALTAICWSRGIKIWIMDTGHSDYIPNEVQNFENMVARVDLDQY